MAISAVATEPDNTGGEWILYMHHDHTAELWYRRAYGTPATSLVGKQILGGVRREISERGITEDGWTPS